jgi:ABC-type Co2+ transport system permease subunit
VEWVVGWGRSFVGAFVGAFVRSFVGAFIGAFIGAFVAAFVAVFIAAFVAAFVAPLGMDVSAGGLQVAASFSGEPTALKEICCCVFQVQHIPFKRNNM